MHQLDSWSVSSGAAASATGSAASSVGRVSAPDVAAGLMVIKVQLTGLACGRDSGCSSSSCCAASAVALWLHATDLMHTHALSTRLLLLLLRAGVMVTRALLTGLACGRNSGSSSSSSCSASAVNCCCMQQTWSNRLTVFDHAGLLLLLRAACRTWREFAKDLDLIFENAK